MKGQVFVGATFLVLIFLIAGQYYEIHHLRVANQTFRQHNQVLPVEQYAAGITEAIDQHNHELREMLSKTLWTTRRLAGCIKALELQHQIISRPPENFSFNYSTPHYSIPSAWTVSEKEEEQPNLYNLRLPVMMLEGYGYPLLFYESYQPEDPNSLYFISKYSGGENTLDHLLSCLHQNQSALQNMNFEYRKLIEQYDARLKVLYHTLKEKKLLREPENQPGKMGPVF